MKKYELMALPYAPEALEPVISKETIGIAVCTGGIGTGD